MTEQKKPLESHQQPKKRILKSKFNLQEISSIKPQLPWTTLSKKVETGTFIRTIIKEGKKQRVTTTQIKPNPAKVVLGHLGEYEVYVYPYDFPTRIFIGKFPNSTSLDRGDCMSMFGLSKTLCWYLNGEPYKSHKMRKGTDAHRRHILKAFEYGRNAERTKNQS